MSLSEAAEYFHIGTRRLRQIIAKDKYAKYLIWNGGRVFFKRKMLRHIFCTRMILGGIDLKTVRIIMDHADAPKNMRVYANVTKTKVQNELMRMEGKMKLK